ncbi:MAG: polysaccharide deacetylase family protein [Pirellulaceae bacterium]
MKRRAGKLWKRISPWFGLGGFRGPAILLYHRVIELESDPQLLAVHPYRFDQHLDVLRRVAQPLPLIQFAERAVAGTLPERAVCVTFDDGYADNLLHARPRLERHDVPATVFVASGQLDSPREFWWDEIERLLLTAGNLPEELSLEIAGERRTWRLGDSAEYTPRDQQRWRRWDVLHTSDPTPRHAVYRQLSVLLRTLTHESQQHALDQLRRTAGVSAEGRGTHRAMSSQQARELADGDVVEVAAHTVTHPVLSKLDVARQHAEIVDSRRKLEEVLGLPVHGFSYPFGTEQDFSDETARIVRAAGFRYACANVEGNVRPRGDRFRLPRFLVRDWDGATFTRKLEEWIGVRKPTARRAG